MGEEIRLRAAFAALAVAPVLAAQTKTPSKTGPITGTFLSVQASNQWLASRLIGLDVYDSANENIGKIRDLVIDRSGAIQALVVGIGGFFRIGAKDIAVSLQSATIMRDRNGDKAQVKLSKPEIERAPSFQEFTGKALEDMASASAKPQ